MSFSFTLPLYLPVQGGIALAYAIDGLIKFSLVLGVAYAASRLLAAIP